MLPISNDSDSTQAGGAGTCWIALKVFRMASNVVDSVSCTDVCCRMRPPGAGAGVGVGSAHGSALLFLPPHPALHSHHRQAAHQEVVERNWAPSLRPQPWLRHALEMSRHQVEPRAGGASDPIELDGSAHAPIEL